MPSNKPTKKFQFQILTGTTEDICMQKYRDLAKETSEGSGVFVHDPYTFYLFDKGGVGFLGDTPLFGGDASKFNMLGTNATYSDLKPDAFYFITADCTITDADPATVTHTCKAGSIWITNGSKVPSEISWTNFTTYMARYIASSAVEKATDVADATYTGDETSLMTSAAIKKLIDENINAQDLLQIAFFSNVSEVITLTAADITAKEVSVTFPGDETTYTASLDTSTDHAGDLGIVFQIRYGDEYDETDSDGDNCRFINLHGLINLYVSDASAQTTQMFITDDTAEHTKKIKVEVNKATKTPAQYEEIILKAVDTVISHLENGGDDPNYPDYDPSNVTDDLSSNKFISESQLADILAHVLVHFAQVVWGSGGGMIDDGDEF